MLLSTHFKSLVGLPYPELFIPNSSFACTPRWQAPPSLPGRGVGWRWTVARRWTTRRCPGRCATTTAQRSRAGRGTSPWSRRRGSSTGEPKHKVFNRPIVAGAVFQTHTLLINWLINWVSQPFPPNLQNIITPKSWELESWNCERMCTLHHLSHVRRPVSCVLCPVSCVRCQVSGVRCQVIIFFFFFS